MYIHIYIDRDLHVQVCSPNSVYTEGVLADCLMAECLRRRVRTRSALVNFCVQAAVMIPTFTPPN